MKINSLVKFPYFFAFSLLFAPLEADVFYPDASPGVARAALEGEEITLSNDLLEARYQLKNGKLSFTGMTARSEMVAGQGGELFVVKLNDGEILPASAMKLTKAPALVNLPAEPGTLKKSSQVPGKALEAVYLSPDQTLRVTWRAVLRDGSHYLRTEMSVASSKDIEMAGIVGMQYAMTTEAGEGIKVSGNTRGSLLVTPQAFAALETPMGKNSVMVEGGEPIESGDLLNWKQDTWTVSSADAPPALKEAFGDQLACTSAMADFGKAGNGNITFKYGSGHFRLNMVGVQLFDQSGKLVDEDLHNGFTGLDSENNTYTLAVDKPGKYQLKFWAETKTERLGSEGNISYAITKKQDENGAVKPVLAHGLWDRHATLKKGYPWRLSSVIGIFTPGQERRSFLSYVERERIVPFRPFVHYNSWFELNVNTNNNPDPLKRMVEKQCLDVMQVWYDKMYSKRGVFIDAFVWDDGWDDFNTLWDFHKGFPRGFKKISDTARRQKAGIGAWLGPVGGYYQSKQMRLASWNKNHPDNQIDNFQLSNEEYYEAFRGRCLQMIKDYDMRYFKLDGISTMATTKGPDEKKEEDAEGILRLVEDLRKGRQDVFINCTVGTWASPFWYRYVDSVWRQGADWSQAGEGNSREKWITYRDHTIWDVFVKGAPLCPINSIMFHGLVVSKHGAPNNMPNDDVQSIKNEMRCAFASGSGLQELYVDHDIFTKVNHEILWDELAKSIKWFRANADVLADTHWVGGTPAQGEIYGWASWNGKKATLALRNPSATPKSINIILRRALDLPANVKGSYIFTNSYSDQRDLDGFTGKPVDVDAEMTFELKPFEVFVFDSRMDG